MKRSPRREEVEEELERPKNTSRSRAGRPDSSTLSKGGGGVSDAQWGLGFSPNASRTRSADIEEVRADVRRLDEKFNFVQNSLLAMMAKLGIPVEAEVGTPLPGGPTGSVDATKSNSRGPVSPSARSASKEPTDKAVEHPAAGEPPIVASPETPSGSQKASSGHEEFAQVCNLGTHL